MDTKTASPLASSKRHSTAWGRPQSPRFSGLATALTLGTGLWLAAVTAGLAQAEVSPLKADATARPSAESVVYADLDLSTPDGARVLLKRIDLAARRICGPGPSHSPLEPRAAAYYRNCVVASVDAAVAGVGSPMLAVMHNDIKSATGATLAAR